jgi:hypothetical protein
MAVWKADTFNIKTYLGRFKYGIYKIQNCFSTVLCGNYENRFMSVKTGIGFWYCQT